MEEQETKKRIILIVEDDTFLSDMYQTKFLSAGYDVHIALDGDQCLSKLKEGLRPDVILLDVVMPHMSGRELDERLTASRPQLKVLYMSGYADALIRHQGLLKPGLAYLQKPFTPEILTQKVRELLDRMTTAFT